MGTILTIIRDRVKEHDLSRCKWVARWFSEFGSLAVEITTLRPVLRRGFVLSEYVPEDYNACEREEWIPMHALSPETSDER